MDKCSGLDLRDVVGGQPCVGDGDDLARLPTASTLLGVGVVAVVHVTVGHQDVPGPAGDRDVRGDGGDPADLAWPGGGEDDGDGAEVEGLAQSLTQSWGGEIEEFLRRRDSLFILAFIATVIKPQWKVVKSRNKRFVKHIAYL